MLSLIVPTLTRTPPLWPVIVFALRRYEVNSSRTRNAREDANLGSQRIGLAVVPDAVIRGNWRIFANTRYRLDRLEVRTPAATSRPASSLHLLAAFAVRQGSRFSRRSIYAIALLRRGIGMYTRCNRLVRIVSGSDEAARSREFDRSRISINPWGTDAFSTTLRYFIVTRRKLASFLARAKIYGS